VRGNTSNSEEEFDELTFCPLQDNGVVDARDPMASRLLSTKNLPQKD